MTEYEEIRERLEHCIERLEKLPSEIEASVTQSSHLETKEKQFIEKLGDIEVSVGKYRQQKDRFCTAFEMEYQLGYVELSLIHIYKAEREVLQYENQFHEVKQETIESVYRWEKENAELHLQSDLLQEMAREIEKYTTETDYWNIRGLANGEFERKSQELSGKVLQPVSYTHLDIGVRSIKCCRRSVFRTAFIRLISLRQKMKTDSFMRCLWQKNWTAK